jgi:hypothetical protein
LVCAYCIIFGRNAGGSRIILWQMLIKCQKMDCTGHDMGFYTVGTASNSTTTEK